MNSNGFKSLAEQIASISCYCAIVLACCTCQSLPAQTPAKTGVPANEAEKNSPHKMPYDSRVRLAFDQFQVETSIGGQGIQVRLHKPEGQFIPMHDAKGVVFIKISGEPKRYRFDLLPNAKGALVASANLMRAKGKQVELKILLASLPTPFVPRGTLKYRDVISVSPSQEQLAEAAIARQGFCPVSGRSLGSMGKPRPVAVATGTIYACCEACVKSIQNEPERYAKGKPNIVASPVTAADTKAIAIQKRCPVMDEPLDSMGGPYKVQAAGRTIYICCPGCSKRIASDPTKYLAILREQGIEPPLFR